jgi:hypothetical protein
MKTARITLVKKQIAKILKGVLKSYGDFHFYDSPPQLEKEHIPCVILSSLGSHFEEESGNLTVKTTLGVDIYCHETTAQEIDFIAESVISGLMRDESCGGLLQKISIKECTEKSFDGDPPMRALLFDFEIFYHLEVDFEF